MLVVKLEAQYFKKATGITIFTCYQGETFATVINEAIRTGEPGIFRSVSKGVNEAGEPVAEFVITWSFKVKS